MIFTPIGYTSPLLFDLSAPHGGSPWGAGTIIPQVSKETRHVSELELNVAKHQGKHIAENVALFKKGRDRMNMTHTVHTTSHPAYPARAPVSAVSWDTPDASYNPVEFTHKVVVENDSTVKEGGWADPQDINLIPKELLTSRISYCGPIEYDSTGYPRNPIGRTGMKGRGLLGKWGPNHAADPIVTRVKPGTEDKIQMVAIERKDTKVWAIPGGMVDAGEKVSQTLKREFTEEAGEVAPEHREAFQKHINELFESNGVEVYRGYVDDPRNTDQAWMETVAVHFHCGSELGNQLNLAAGDDASSVKWLDVDESIPEFGNLYASHKMMVLDAVKGLRHRLKSAEENKAASKLQQLFRGRSSSARKTTEEDIAAKKKQQEEEEAAKVLQGAFREHRASIKQHEEEENAAKTLQHAFREHRSSMKGRDEFVTGSESSKMHGDINFSVENEAAKTLQSAFRVTKKARESDLMKKRGEFKVGDNIFRTGVKKLHGKSFASVEEYISFLKSE